MKLTSKKLTPGSNAELQMTSMIDVIFLLMIFFLVTASFTKTEKELDTATKVKEKASSQASDLEPAIIEVKQGDGRFVYYLGTNQYNTHEELTEVLKQFPNKADGAFVRASDSAPYAMAAAAIQAAKSAGFQTVSYVPLVDPTN